jgi:MFS family permease
MKEEHEEDFPNQVEEELEVEEKELVGELITEIDIEKKNEKKYNLCQLSRESKFFVLYLAFINLTAGSCFGFGNAIIGVVVANSKIYFTEVFDKDMTELNKNIYGSLIPIVLFLGGFVGVILFNIVISPSKKRRVFFLLCSVVGVIGILGCVLSYWYIMLLFFNFIFGFFIGIVNLLAPLYAIENSPPKYRGKIGVFFQLGIF